MAASGTAVEPSYIDALATSMPVNWQIMRLKFEDRGQRALRDFGLIRRVRRQELPKLSAKVEQGKAFAVVESVKAASDIYAPVSGEVIAINDALTNAPETLNADPHVGGWIAKIKLSVPEEVDRLLSPSDYQAYLGAE